MTTKSHPAGFRIPVHFKGKDGLILLDQIRTLDKRRLLKRLGAVSDAVLDMTLDRLCTVFER